MIKYVQGSKANNKIALTEFFSFFHSFFVRRLLNNFVHISSSNEVIRSVPHRKPGGRVIEENTLIASPHHTPRSLTENKVLFCFTIFMLPYSKTKKEQDKF